MIQFSNGGCLVEAEHELPAAFVNAEFVFADFETSSGSAKETSVNPWHNCYIRDSAGVAVTVDKCPIAYYVPAHILNTEGGRTWLRDVLCTATYWANHAIKYDAHVAANCLDIITPGHLVCTLTLAKLIDSDKIMRGGYGLDALSRDWLQKPIDHFEKRLQPYLKNNKDYGRIALDIIAEYACQDVLTNREVLEFIWANLPEQCNGVAQTEILLTRRLWQMERNGMRYNEQEVKVEQLKALNRMCQLDDELTAIVGRSFRPHVNEDCFDVLCNQYGLPILAYTKDQHTGEETTNPSFDKHALVRYAVYPGAPDGVVPRIQEFRELNQFNNLFLEGWQELGIGGDDGFAILHPNYNQAVRTGRLACGQPNAQQLNKRAKSLIRPRKGCKFLSCDASQIEFRLIAHYINDPKIIQAYIDNPDTDFHVWVARGVYDIDELEFQALEELIQKGMRDTGKTVNFGMAFGEGKKKLIKQLSVNPYIVRQIAAIVDNAVATGACPVERRTDLFLSLSTKRATDVYEMYHRTLPTLKETMKKVEMSLRRYGFVFNVYGRHRHLPVDKAYRGFNTINQSSAADMMKERFVEICNALDSVDILTTANVHDEMLLDVPDEIIDDPRFIRDTIGILESPRAQLRVPIRWSYGVSGENWRNASKSAKTLQYNKAECTNLEYLQGNLSYDSNSTGAHV